MRSFFISQISPLIVIVVLLITSVVIASILLLRSSFPGIGVQTDRLLKSEPDNDKTHTQIKDEAIRELVEEEEVIPGVKQISLKHGPSWHSTHPNVFIQASNRTLA
jgi:hypothetical protein